MPRFKVGDRVRVYGAYNELLEVSPAIIEAVLPNSLLYVNMENAFLDNERTAQGGGYVHPIQCRKLVKKKKRLPRRRIVLNSEDINFVNLQVQYHLAARPVGRLHSGDSPGEWAEFVEVKRLK